MLPVVATWLLTYAVTGALIVLGVWLIWVAYERLPVSSQLITVLGVSALIGYTLSVRNILAIVGSLTVILALLLIWLLVWVPRMVPRVTDAVSRLLRGDRAPRPAGRTHL